MAGSTHALPTADVTARAPAEGTRVSLGLEAWRRFRRHRLAVASAALLGLIILTVVLEPLWWQVPINDIDFAARLAGPSWQHPFGTDDLGQDLFARLLYGGRISLAVGLAAMLVAVIVGTIIGALAGISRGSVGAALMWLTDLFLSLPQLPLLLLIIYLFRDTLKALVGLEAGVFILIVAVIGGFRWMPVARLVRAQFLSLREKEFVEAARARRIDDAPGGAPHPAQRARPGDRRRHDRGRLRDHRGVDAVVPWPRLPAGHSHLGTASLRCQGLPRHRAALGTTSRRRDLSHRADDQLHRRRIARRPRPSKGVVAVKV